MVQFEDSGILIVEGDEAGYTIPLLDTGVFAIWLMIRVKTQILFLPLVVATQEDEGSDESIETVLNQLGFEKREARVCDMNCKRGQPTSEYWVRSRS